MYEVTKVKQIDLYEKYFFQQIKPLIHYENL